jgi:hypothetical protein
LSIVTSTSGSRRWNALPPDERVFVFASLAAIVLISLGWAHPGTVIAQGDRSPILDPLHETARCVSAWGNSGSYVGQLNPCFGLTPWGLLYSLFLWVFGISFGQVLLTGVVLALAWLGAFRCARSVGISPTMACLAAWAYTFNPSHQTFVLILPTFDITTALVPWLFYWLIEAAKPERRSKATLLIAVIAALFAGTIATTPQLLLETVLGCLAWTVLAAQFASDRRAFAAWVARTFALVALVSIWWAVPSAIAEKSGDILRVVTLGGNGWIFARASLLNELRFIATWAWRFPEYFPWAAVFDRSAPLYASTFLLVAGLIAGLLLARGRELLVVRFCGALGLIMLFLSKGAHQPFEFLNELFFKIPGMFLFIETLGAITVAALCFALCLGIALDAAPRFVSRVPIKPILAAAAVAATVLGGSPMITGAVFHEPSWYEPAMHVRVPAYWQALATYLNRSAAAGSVFMLPADTSYQADYTWGFYGSDVLAHDLFHRTVLVPGAPHAYVVPHAQVSIERKLTSMIEARSALTPAVLRDLGFRYVLFRNDVRLPFGFPYSARDAHAIFGAYPQQRFGALDLYDLGTPAGRLTAAGAVVASKSATVDAGDQVELRSLEERLPRIDAPAALGALIAFTETQPPSATPGERLVWRNELSASVGIVRGQSNGGELRASYAVDRTPNTRLVRAYTQLRFLNADTGVPVPRIVGRSYSERGGLDVDVIDPSARIIRCDVSVGVRPRRAASYLLLVNGIERGRARVRPGDSPTWIRFASVRLLPGRNHLAVIPSSYTLASYAVLLPPRAITGGAFDPYEGQTIFSRIRADARPAPIVEARMIHPLGLITNVSVRNGAELLLSSDVGVAGRGSDWIIGVRYRGANYQCFERFFVGTPARLADSVRECFDALGFSLDADDEAHLYITSLWLMTWSGRERGIFAPFDRLSLASRTERPVIVDVVARAGKAHLLLPPSQSAIVVRRVPGGSAFVSITGSASDVSNLAIGEPPHGPPESDLPLLFHFDGIYIARCQAAPQLIIARDSYHPTWFAISILPGLHVLPHLRADGWRNAWLASQPGLFVAVNGLVLFEIAFFLMSLVVLVWLWRTAR